MTKINISSGQTSSGLAVGSGNALDIFSGGTVLDSTIGAGALEFVYNGGQSLNDTVQSGGTQYIASGGLAVLATIAAGGTEVVFAGGTASSTVVSGGLQQVLIGATVVDAVIEAGGIQTIGKGASVSGTHLLSGGEEINSGTASGTVVATGGFLLNSGTTIGADIQSGGLDLVLSGGSASGTTVESGGILIALPGASTAGTVLQSGAIVASTGVLIASGTGFAYSSAIADGTTLDGATEILLANTSATGQTVQNNSEVLLLSGAVVNSATVVESLVIADAGGTIENSIIALLSIAEISGGLAVSNTVELVSEEYIVAGGRSEGSFFFSGGILKIADGGTGHADLIGYAGTATVLQGGVADHLIVSGGVEFVVGIDSGTSLLQGGLQYVYGVASSDSVGYGGSQEVVAGGVASQTVVSNGGFQTVDNGALARGTTEQAAGHLTVNNGGVVSSAFELGSASIYGRIVDGTVASGAIQYIYSGGVAQGGTVASGGLEFVYDGGSATSMSIDRGGFVVVLDGGQITSLTSSAGKVVSTGIFIEKSGGGYAATSTIADTTIAQNTYIVLKGGSFEHTTFTGSASVQVYDGTIADSIIEASADIAIGGNATLQGTTLVDNLLFAFGTGIDNVLTSNTALGLEGGAIFSGTINSGSIEFLFDNAQEIGGTITDGGYMSIGLDGTASDMTLIDGGRIYNNWRANSTVVSSGGAIRTTFNAVENATTLDAYANGFVLSGGTANNDQIRSGVRFVGSGAVENGATISAGGFQVVAGGGTVTGDVVLSGGSVIDLDHTLVSGGYTSAAGANIVSTGVIYVDSSADQGFTVANDGSLLVGGTYDAGTLYVLSGGTLSGAVVQNAMDVQVRSGGAVQGVTLSGSFTVSGVQSSTEMFVSAGATDVGTVIQNGGSAFVYGAVSLSATIGSGGHEFISGGGVASATHVLAGGELSLRADSTEAIGVQLDVGAEVQVLYEFYGSGISATLDQATNTLFVTSGGQSYGIGLEGDYSQDSFVVTAGYQDIAVVTVEGTACYCPGTLIATEQGEVAIETLQIGDRVLTRTGAARALRWIGRRSYHPAFAARNPAVLPVIIRAGALGDAVPRQDLMVSQCHALYLHGVLVPAGALIDGVGIVLADAGAAVEYLHLELDDHDVIVANGALAETFVDDGSRGMFHNAHEFAQLYPGSRAGTAAYCAPRVECGEQLDEICRTLATRHEPGLLPLIGAIDDVTGGVATGWARSGDSAAPVTLRLRVDGMAVAMGAADLLRPDLLAAGIGDGRHGFAIALPPDVWARGFANVQLERATDGARLPTWSSPAARAPRRCASIPDTSTHPSPACRVAAAQGA